MNLSRWYRILKELRLKLLMINISFLWVFWCFDLQWLLNLFKEEGFEAIGDNSLVLVRACVYFCRTWLRFRRHLPLVSFDSKVLELRNNLALLQEYHWDFLFETCWHRQIFFSIISSCWVLAWGIFAFVQVTQRFLLSVLFGSFSSLDCDRSVISVHYLVKVVLGAGLTGFLKAWVILRVDIFETDSLCVSDQERESIGSVTFVHCWVVFLAHGVNSSLNQSIPRWVRYFQLFAFTDACHTLIDNDFVLFEKTS